MITDFEDIMRKIKIFSKLSLTDEQTEICRSINQDLIVFADPGTGKTATLSVAMMIAQLVYHIPGSKILCMSYTKAATNEIAVRFSKLCKAMGTSSSVNFNTFHSAAYHILKLIHPNIGLVDRDIEASVTKALEIAELKKLREINEENVKAVINGIGRFNAKGITDFETLKRKREFKKLGVSFETYDMLREALFASGLYKQEIPRAEIPYYTIYELQKNKSILQQVRDKFDLVIVDEFQDMSFIYLVLLNMIAKNVVVVGDMKQQIFGFNGSSEDIVEQFLRMRINPKQLKLTKSFRCSERIADYASNIIRYNSLNDYQTFKGAKEGGSVNIICESDLRFDTILEGLNKEIAEQKFDGYMFLFRNNASSLRLIHQLYLNKVPILTVFKPDDSETYQTVLEQPLIRDLYEIIKLSKDRKDYKLMEKVFRKLPEFRYSNEKELTIVKLMRTEPEKAKRVKLSENTKGFLLDLNLLYHSVYHKEPLRVLLDKALQMLKKYYAGGKYYKNKIPYDEEYYFNLIHDVIKDMTLEEVERLEEDKKEFIRKYNRAGYGVRCLTMHKAKGLEANHVYIFDYDAEATPDMRRIIKYADEGYIQDASEYIRSERNLIFVGITRAKDDVTLIYNNEVSPFADAQQNVNVFELYDNEYKLDMLEASKRTVKIGNLEIISGDKNSVEEELNPLEGE